MTLRMPATRYEPSENYGATGSALKGKRGTFDVDVVFCLVAVFFLSSFPAAFRPARRSLGETRCAHAESSLLSFDPRRVLERKRRTKKAHAYPTNQSLLLTQARRSVVEEIRRRPSPRPRRLRPRPGTIRLAPLGRQRERAVDAEAVRFRAEVCSEAEIRLDFGIVVEKEKTERRKPSKKRKGEIFFSRRRPPPPPRLFTPPTHTHTPKQKLTQSADKEAALKSLRSLKSGASAALAKHEEELKNSVRAASAAAGASDAATATAETSGLTELDSTNFWKFIKEDAGESLVVVDFYTTWCGPCKLMMPKLVEFSAARGGKMVGAKFECNAKNKDLGKELEVRSVPTFQLYKGGVKVATMTGAKPDELEKLIDEHM